MWILLRQKYTLYHFTTKIAVFLIFYFDFVEKNLSEIIFYLQCYLTLYQTLLMLILKVQIF